MVLLLVGILVAAFAFIGFRQLRSAQERRLRLLAGFGERVESTVADLADRFVRIVKVEESDKGDVKQRGERRVERYLEHVPHVSLLKIAATCEKEESSGEDDGGSVDLLTSGRRARLVYCPPEEEASQSDVSTSEEETRRGYLARIELEKLIEPMIIPGVFDSVVLADRSGEVLVQQGEPELRMLDLGPLIRSSGNGDQRGGLTSWRALAGRQNPDDGTLDLLLPEEDGDRGKLSLGARTAMVEVEIAGSDYYAFLQPVSPRLEPPPGHGGGKPVRWVACGLISEENLLSAGLTTSPFLLFVLVSILPLALITWPFLKLSLITRRQRFTRLDVASLFLATVLGISLGALLVFDLLFLARLHGNLDRQLEELAEAIADRFHSEILDARDQLAELNEASSGLLPTSPEDPKKCTGDGKVPERIENLGDLDPVGFIEGDADKPGRRASHLFIQDRVHKLLQANQIDQLAYPYFDSVFWATAKGEHGCANLPLVEDTVLPQNVEDRGYFLCARDCDPEPFLLPSRGNGGPALKMAVWKASDPGPGCGESLVRRAGEGSVPVCLQSLLDRTTGESVAALALPGPSKDFPVAALVTRLTSVKHPVLPPGFGFAIVERGGRVLFHSEPQRDLTESFLKASDDNALLRSMIEQRRRGHLSLHYWGRPTRVYLEPIEGLPAWSLVTFRDTYDLRVRNFELVYDFLNPFLLYLGILLLVAIVVWTFTPRRYRRYLWPSARYRDGYRAVVLATPVAVAHFGFALLSRSPGWIFLASAAALPATALLAILAVWGTQRLREQQRHKTPTTILLILTAAGALMLVFSGAQVVVVPESISILARLTLLAPLIWHWTSFQQSWQRKRLRIPLAILLVLAALGSFLLMQTEARVMVVLVAILTLALVAALAWQWYSFGEERRKVAFIFALGCALVVTALLPALGFFHLARSRQNQLYTQEAQVALARRLEERDKEIEERHGPLSYLYPKYNDEEIGDSRERYLNAAFKTIFEDRRPDGWEAEEGERPWWPFGLDREDTPGLVPRLLSARPFPLNDLSARPVESDLSRFGASEDVEWRRPTTHELMLVFPTRGGTGEELYLASTMPLLETLDGPLRGWTLFLGLLLLGGSPFLLAYFLADQVFFITLVGEPNYSPPSSRTLTPAQPASKPLTTILHEVHQTNDVVRQVVLVSTLPDWKNQIEKIGKIALEDPQPCFHPVSFREAWRNACNTPTAKTGWVEKVWRRIAGGPAEDDSGDESERFYQELSPPDAEKTENGQKRRKPVLLTEFDPALDDPAVAAAQVAALQRLSDDGRSVVITAETVPDPALAADHDRTSPAAEARHRWKELLATYSVEYGYDDRTHNLGRRVSNLERRIENLFEKTRVQADLSEDLSAIQRTARLIVRECSPTPVLRSIGWTLLEEIDGALGEVKSALDKRLPAAAETPRSEPSPGGEEVESALRSLVTPGTDKDAAADHLAEVLNHGNTEEKLVEAARSIAHDETRQPTEVIEQASEALRSAKSADREEQRKKAMSLLDKVFRDLLRDEFSRERLRRGRSLLQLITTDYVIAKVGAQARLHYRYLWSRCTDDEKMVLVQLSEDGLVNPKYFGWVMDLMNRGLILRDPEVRLINASFRRFVHQEVQRSQILEWQEQEGPNAWSVLKWILPAPLLLVAIFLFVTQRDAMSNVTGVVVALVSLAPILINLYGQFQQINARRESDRDKKKNDEDGSSSGSE